MANRFVEIEENKNPEQEAQAVELNDSVNESTKKKKGRLAKSITAVFGGNFLDNPNIIKLIPFILFLSLLGLGYIANGYWADNKIRQLNKLNNELKELRTEHVFVQSELESSTNENNIAKKAEKLGLSETRIPPKKILVRDSSMIKENGK